MSLGEIRQHLLVGQAAHRGFAYAEGLLRPHDVFEQRLILDTFDRFRAHIILLRGLGESIQFGARFLVPFAASARQLFHL